MFRPRIELSESKTSLLENKDQYSVLINEIDQDPIKQALEAEKKLSLCIAMLKSQIRKKRLPRKIFHLSVPVGIYCLVNDVVKSYFIFNDNISQLENTFVRIGNYNKSCAGASLVTPPINSYHFFGSHIDNNECREYLDNLNRNILNETRACVPLLENLCDGPGMWYFYNVVVLGSAATLLVLSVLDLKKKRAPFIRIETNSCLAHLSAEKSETIRRYAQKYNIAIPENANLETILKNFEDKLQVIQKQLENFKGRVTFMMGLKEPDSSIFRFSKDTLFDRQLCNEIFAFNDPVQASQKKPMSKSKF